MTLSQSEYIAYGGKRDVEAVKGVEDEWEKVGPRYLTNTSQTSHTLR